MRCLANVYIVNKMSANSLSISGILYGRIFKCVHKRTHATRLEPENTLSYFSFVTSLARLSTIVIGALS